MWHTHNKHVWACISNGNRWGETLPVQVDIKLRSDHAQNLCCLVIIYSESPGVNHGCCPPGVSSSQTGLDRERPAIAPLSGGEDAQADWSGLKQWAATGDYEGCRYRRLKPPWSLIGQPAANWQQPPRPRPLSLFRFCPSLCLLLSSVPPQVICLYLFKERVVFLTMRGKNTSGS